jgi:hypothetical protein
MLSNNPKLNALLEQANAAVAAMTPEERAAMRREQRISWVRGEMQLARLERGLEPLPDDEATARAERAVDQKDGNSGKG